MYSGKYEEFEEKIVLALTPVPLFAETATLEVRGQFSQSESEEKLDAVVDKFPFDGTSYIVSWGFATPDTPVGDYGHGDATDNTLLEYLNRTFGSNDRAEASPEEQPWFELFTDALQFWEDVINVDFRFERNDDGAPLLSDGIPEVRANLRFAGQSIDGTGNVLGYSFRTAPTDIIFDTSDHYFDDPELGKLLFTNAIAHEAGHALGFPHIVDTQHENLMEATLNSGFLGPQAGDIELAQSIYGEPGAERGESSIHLGDPDNGGTAFDNLTAAMQAATASAGNQELVFSAGRFDFGDFELKKTDGTLVLKGAGRGVTYIESQSVDRLLKIMPTTNVQFENLTLTGGQIWNLGSASFHQVDIRFAKADTGGALLNEGGATANFVRSSLFGNSARIGGAIAVVGGEVTLLESNVWANSSTDSGGGIYVGPQGSIQVIRSTVSGNHAIGEGGGMVHLGITGQSVFSDSTLSGNTSTEGTSGIFNRGRLIVNGSTIAFNVPKQGEVGGIRTTEPLEISNSIVAGNHLSEPRLDLLGPIDSRGGNLVGAARAADWNSDADIVGTIAAPLDPGLGPLQNNGGPTETHALFFGSPARGLAHLSNAQTLDQRNRERADFTTSDSTDSGAYTYAAAPFAEGGEVLVATDFETADMSDKFRLHSPAASAGFVRPPGEDNVVFETFFTDIEQYSYLYPPKIAFDSVLADYTVEFPDGLPTRPFWGNVRIFRTEGLQVALTWGHAAPQLSIRIIPTATSVRIPLSFSPEEKFRLTVYAKYNDADLDNGIVKIWLNDHQVWTQNSQILRTDGEPANWLQLGGGNGGAPGLLPFRRWIDDVTIVTDPITVNQTETPSVPVSILTVTGAANVVRDDIDLKSALQRSNRLTSDREIRLAAGTFRASQLIADKQNGALTIRGAGKDKTFIDAEHAARLLHVLPGTKLTIRDATLMNGKAESGGILWNQGELTLINVGLIGGDADLGGGLFNDAGAEATVQRSEFFENVANLSAAGIYNRGELELLDTTLAWNRSNGPNGRGAAIATTGSLTVSGSTFSNNDSAGDAGAIYIHPSGTVKIVRSTFSANSAAGMAGAVLADGSLDVEHSTFTLNHAETSGGAIVANNGTVTMLSTVAADNFAGGTHDDVAGPFTSKGGNVWGVGPLERAPQDVGGTSAAPLDPKLQPLATHGGLTSTHVPEPDSPLLRAGLESVSSQVDQRRVPWAQQPASGAVEPNSHVVPILGDVVLDWDFEGPKHTGISEQLGQDWVLAPSKVDPTDTVMSVAMLNGYNQITRNGMIAERIYVEFELLMEQAQVPTARTLSLSSLFHAPMQGDVAVHIRRDDNGIWMDTEFHTFQHAPHLKRLYLDWPSDGFVRIAYYRDFPNGTYSLWFNDDLILEINDLPPLPPLTEGYNIGLGYSGPVPDEPIQAEIHRVKVIADPSHVVAPRPTGQLQLPELIVHDADPVVEGGILEFKVELVGEIIAAVSVYLLGAGEATHPSDFEIIGTAGARRQLSFVPGGPSSQIVKLNTIFDRLEENDERVSLAVTQADNVRIRDSIGWSVIRDVSDVIDYPIEATIRFEPDSPTSPRVVPGNPLPDNAAVIFIKDGVPQAEAVPERQTPKVEDEDDGVWRVLLPIAFPGVFPFIFFSGRNGAHANSASLSTGNPDVVRIIERNTTWNQPAFGQVFYVKSQGSLHLEVAHANTIVAEAGAKLFLGPGTTSNFVIHTPQLHFGTEPDVQPDVQVDGDAQVVIATFVGVNPAQPLTTAPLFGDTNSDGEVLFDDFLQFTANFGRAADVAWADGDFDGNQRIDFADFLLLAENFGRRADQ